MRRIGLALLLLTAPSGCFVPTAVANLDAAPPAAFGRPAIVRWPAKVGAWLGGIVGGVASVALLPITYPVSLLADEPLGYSKDEFLFGPAAVGAATGHYILGAPIDSLHYLAYRAWVDAPEEPAYDYRPQIPPAGPDFADEAARRADEAAMEPPEAPDRK